MSEETKNPLIESFLKLHNKQLSEAGGVNQQNAISKTANILSAAADKKQPPPPVNSGSSQMTVPIVQQATAAGNMAQANKAPDTPAGMQASASNYEKMRKDFDTSTPQMKVGTTTSNLRTGSSGENVAYVQRQLGIKADKQYGDDTKKAVMDYQRKYGLKVDGIVGDQTLSHMKRQEGFNKLKSENPIGAKALDNRTTQRISAREPGGSVSGGTIKPTAPNNLVGPGASKPLNTVSDKPFDLSGRINRNDLESTGLAGRTLTGNDPVERSVNLQKRVRNLARARESGSFLVQGDNTNMPSKIIEAFMKLQSKNPTDLFAEAKKAKNSHHDKDKDGDKDFADVMISRMVASGMSREEAIAKVKSKTYNEGVLGIPAKKPTTEKGSVMPGYDDEDKPTIKPMPKVKGSLMPGYNEEIDPKIRPRKDPYGEGIAKPGTKAPEMVPAKEKPTGGVSPKGDLPKDAARSLEREREQAREIGEKGSRQRSIIDAAKEAANRGGGFRTPEAIAKGTGAMIAQPFAKAIDAVMGYKKPESKVMRTGPNSSIVMKNEEVEQLDEATFKLTDAHKSAITKHLKNNLGKGKVTFHSEHGGHFATHSDGIQSTVHHIQMKNGKMTLSHFMTMDEEVEFSEAELEHFAAILEGPVAPTPDGHDVKAFGSSTSISGTLTDEAIAEEEKKKRGRKPGVKVGAYGPRGAKKGEGEATTNVSVPHVFHQIRTSRADSQGNYNLQHEHGGKTLNAKVPARDAAEFSKKYMNTEKPREKEAHTDAFVAKHFGVSKPKSTGITLPKMPPAKS